jgi:hypothetical protein
MVYLFFNFRFSILLDDLLSVGLITIFSTAFGFSSTSYAAASLSATKTKLSTLFPTFTGEES